MVPAILRAVVDGLPPAARRLLASTAVAALALATAVVVRDPHGPSAWGALVLAVALVAGEGFRVDLPYRGGGVARFTLGDAVLLVGLVLLSAVDVVAAAVLAIVFCQAVERVPAPKFAFNLAQYVAGAAGAALLVELLVPAHGILGPQTFGSAALGMVVFLVVQTVTVGGIIARTSERPWLGAVRRLAPISVILAIGNAGLGLLALLLARHDAWALPALGVPLVLLFSASRQEVRAQVDRERSAAFVDVEQRLSGALSPEAVCALLVAGVAAILGCNAAVWREGRWVTPVPDGSGPCPLDPDLAVALRTAARVLGIGVDGDAVAVGVGGGVLVVWAGELGLTREGEQWVERLARSGRGSFDRAAAHAALEQERATLRAVVDGTGDGILVLDAAGVVRLCNPAMARLAQVDADAALGQRAETLLGAGPWGTEGVHDVTFGERTWRVSVAGVQDDHDARLHVAVVHDVSAERRVARMKDDMLSIVSHELRTPLTPIKASAQLLRRRWERLDSGRRGELLAQIEGRADHLARLVDDLLLVGQLSANAKARPRLALAPVDLAELLRDDLAQLALARADHDLVLAAPAAVPTLTDPLRVRQIVDNLVDNACKFSPAGSRVDVVLDVGDGCATLRVADAGRGIPPEDLERVFERFERVEDPLHMTTSGAGLGLSIVRALCEALGGTVTADSTVGAGTTMTVRLPLVPVTLPDDAAPAAARVPLQH
jgi:signal transduction histidine kinase